MLIVPLADRAKQIKTKAVVNEDPTEKLLRELMEENERMKKQLSGAGGGVDMAAIQAAAGKDNLSKDEYNKYKKQLEEEMEANQRDNERAMAEMKRSYEEKLKAAQADKKKLMEEEDVLAKVMADKNSKPHITNMNVDPQLHGRLVHMCTKPSNSIGNQKPPKSDIVMTGPGIHAEHAVISESGGKFKIKPVNKDCRLLVNGQQAQGETDLQHNDRVVVGATQIWLFQNPKENTKGKHYPPITWEYAQEEIASNAGLNMANGYSLLQDDVMQVLPAIEEANSISEELDKRVKFEVFLCSPQMAKQMKSTLQGFENRNMNSTEPEVCVKMKNLEQGTEFIWPREKFLNRLFMMKEMYSNYEDEDDWDVPKEKDPFEEENREVMIGSVNVFLQPMAYRVEMRESLDITDMKGNEVGTMNVSHAHAGAHGQNSNEETPV